MAHYRPVAAEVKTGPAAALSGRQLLATTVVLVRGSLSNSNGRTLRTHRACIYSECCQGQLWQQDASDQMCCKSVLIRLIIPHQMPPLRQQMRPTVLQQLLLSTRRSTRPCDRAHEAVTHTAAARSSRLLVAQLVPNGCSCTHTSLSSFVPQNLGRLDAAAMSM